MLATANLSYPNKLAAAAPLENLQARHKKLAEEIERNTRNTTTGNPYDRAAAKPSLAGPDDMTIIAELEHGVNTV